MKLTKKHYIVHAIYWFSLRTREEIMQKAYELEHGHLRGFKASSNVDYLCTPSPGTYTYEKRKSISLVSKGLVEQHVRGRYRLTNAGVALAKEIGERIQAIVDQRRELTPAQQNRASDIAESKGFPPNRVYTSPHGGQAPGSTYPATSEGRSYEDIKGDAVKLTGKYMANGFQETPELRDQTIRLIGEILSRL